jgi:hypothetical protein
MSDELASTHLVVRTSPKGERFIGTCVLCGTTGLTSSAPLEHCDNQRGLTQDQALIEAIEAPARGFRDDK